MSGRRKRDSMEILEEMLRVILEERAASKTRITNRANLNLASFNRHMEFLERAGAVAKGYEEGRPVYLATPRAAGLLALIEVLRAAGAVDERVLRRYSEMVRVLAESLASRRYAVRLGQLLRVRSVTLFYDVVAVGSCIVGFLVAPPGDPLNYVRLWTIVAWVTGKKPQGLDKTIVYGDDELVSRMALLAGLPVSRRVEEAVSVAC